MCPRALHEGILVNYGVVFHAFLTWTVYGGEMLALLTKALSPIKKKARYVS
jgi:hypothetical protein